jgi:hypothetical protein
MVGVIEDVYEAGRRAKVLAPHFPHAIRLHEFDFQNAEPLTHRLIGRTVVFELWKDRRRGWHARECWLTSADVLEMASENRREIEEIRRRVSTSETVE